MRQAIGNVLPLAIAAGLSPIPIIGVVLMLVTPRASGNSLMFVVGWLAGLAIVGVIGLTIASAAGASDNGAPSNGANTTQIVLGAVLVLMAGRRWRSRPKGDEEPEMPKWMSAVEDFGPLQAAGLGVALSAVNPKNLILTLGAATSIAATNISGADQAIAFAVYALIATIGVAAPVVIYFTMGTRAQPILDNLKTWLGRNNNTILAVILLLIGAKLIGQGVAG